MLCVNGLLGGCFSLNYKLSRRHDLSKTRCFSSLRAVLLTLCVWLWSALWTVPPLFGFGDYVLEVGHEDENKSVLFSNELFITWFTIDWLTCFVFNNRFSISHTIRFFFNILCVSYKVNESIQLVRLHTQQIHQPTAPLALCS